MSQELSAEALGEDERLSRQSVQSGKRKNSPVNSIESVVLFSSQYAVLLVPVEPLSRFILPPLNYPPASFSQLWTHILAEYMSYRYACVNVLVSLNLHDGGGTVCI